ncbi:MAG: hypothetical protein RLZZ362_2115 [Actinomycetota bacterium]|jgi:Tfp pilus assembly protein PilX
MIRHRHHQHERPDRHRHERPDRGDTFVEILTAVVVLGIVIVPLFDAVIAAVTSSTVNRSTAQAESALQDASDRINRSPLTCDYSALAAVAAQAQGWSPSAATVVHQRYVPGPDASVGGTWVSGACVDGVITPNMVQSITITITAPGARASRSMQVVKSDV